MLNSHRGQYLDRLLAKDIASTSRHVAVLNIWLEMAPKIDALGWILVL